MTIQASHIVPPVLAASIVIVFFSTAVTLQTRIGNLLSRLFTEPNDLCLVAAGIDVRFAGAMAGLATLIDLCPFSELRKFYMSGVSISFELLFVAGLAGLVANEICRIDFRWRRFLSLSLFGAGRL